MNIQWPMGQGGQMKKSLLFVLLAGLWACESVTEVEVDMRPPPADTTATNATSVAVVMVSPKSTKLKVGETAQALVACYNNAGVTLSQCQIFWQTADASVVDVSQSGLITARGTGATQVCANASSGVRDCLTAEVESPPPPPADTTTKVVAFVKIPSALTLKVGESATLTPVCSNGRNETIPCPSPLTWTSATPNVASVSSGLVKGVAPGVTAVCVAVSPSIYGCSVVTVEAVPPAYTVLGVFPSPVWFSVACRQTQQMSVVVTGNGPVPQTVRWSVSDTTIAVVSEAGLVTPRKNGTFLVHAVSTADTTKRNHSYGTSVLCTEPVAPITINIFPATTVNGKVGERGQVTCSVTGGPASFTDRRCWFLSEGVQVVQVVQKDTTFTTNTPPWGVGAFPAGLLSFMKEGQTQVCAFSPALPLLPRACTGIVVTR